MHLKILLTAALPYALMRSPPVIMRRAHLAIFLNSDMNRLHVPCYLGPWIALKIRHFGFAMYEYLVISKSETLILQIA